MFEVDFLSYKHYHVSSRSPFSRGILVEGIAELAAQGPNTGNALKKPGIKTCVHYYCCKQVMIVGWINIPIFCVKRIIMRMV